MRKGKELNKSIGRNSLHHWAAGEAYNASKISYGWLKERRRRNRKIKKA